MKFSLDYSLKAFNTFGIDAKAAQFARVDHLSDLEEILRLHNPEQLFVLGGGSNMLLLGDVPQTVIQINLKGISQHSQNDSHVELDIMAGENWHQTVMYCVEQGFGGIENLSLIPGNIGAAPIQNIGAYGVELKDVFVSCTAINRYTLAHKTFSHSDCKFGYRDSYFKGEGKDQYIITSVRLKLTVNNHKLNTQYGAIQAQLEAMGSANSPSIKDISKAVIAIRSSKLPDPKDLGNSGSFFKNPVLSKTQFESFQERFPEAPFYTVSALEFKVPAGWLIEQAGFKGERFGDAGVHKNQALVLVNYGNAQGKEIWDLALKIQATVLKKFNISLTPEVNIIGL